MPGPSTHILKTFSMRKRHEYFIPDNVILEIYVQILFVCML